MMYTRDFEEKGWHILGQRKSLRSMSEEDINYRAYIGVNEG